MVFNEQGTYVETDAQASQLHPSIKQSRHNRFESVIPHL